MAHQILRTCTNCGACLSICPTQSILAGKEQHVIDIDTCDDHAHCVSICPVNAIKPIPPSQKAAAATAKTGKQK